MSLDLLVCFDLILLPEYKGVIYIQGTLKSARYRMYNIQDSTSSFSYMLPQGIEDTTTKNPRHALDLSFS